MAKTNYLKGLLAVGLLAAWAGWAEAGRVPPTRTDGFKSTGARTDVTVPYLTTGRSAFMPGYAAPYIYSSPILDDARSPGVRPVFNLQFWGAVQAFGDRSNGAVPRR
jgi:hypothetical protein